MRLGPLPHLLWLAAALAAPSPAAADSPTPGPLVFHEIAWMGTAASAQSEWIELRNLSHEPLTLEGWILAAADGVPQIRLQGTAPPHAHFLLERTGDDTVPEVAADQVYTGALGNGGEHLTLRDPQGRLADQVDAWHAGHNGTKQTMQRFDPTAPGTDPRAWLNGPVGGTPQNSAGQTPPPAPSQLSAYFTDNVSATGVSPALTEMEGALVELLDSACCAIDAALYGLDRASVRDALLAAHGRGVRVRLVADDDARAQAAYSPHFRALEMAGIPLLADGRSGLMHNKFFVVDGRAVWTGSTNMTDTCFTLNHNNSLRIDSSWLAYVYGVEFHEMFALARFGPAKADNTPHRLPGDSPYLASYFSPSDGGLDHILAEIARAESELYFAAFAFTSHPIAQTLLARLNEGVAVRGLWDRLGATNRYALDDPLCTAGAAIKIENFPGKMHHKFAVVDPHGPNAAVITGSANWSNAGFGANDENLLIIRDGALAAQYQREWQRLWDALPNRTLCSASPLTLFLPLLYGSASQPAW
ncbi:MAG: hypothetical protein GX605_09170 [Chloroflexi bacterium]|nr:hypothetical protein [Chloroflexota bacterium]